MKNKTATFKFTENGKQSFLKWLAQSQPRSEITIEDYTVTKFVSFKDIQDGGYTAEATFKVKTSVR